MRKFLFFTIVIILLAALGAVFYFTKNEVSYSANFALSDVFKLPLFNELSPTPQYQIPDENLVFQFPVFNYHHIRPMPSVASSTITDRAFTVSPEGLETHLKYFRDNGYTVVPLSALIEYFDTGKPLPQKSLAITFDDGWLEHYKNAFPILKKYGVSATFFVPTDWVGQREIMTWAQMREMSEASMTFGSHSLNHANLASLGDIKLRRQLIESKKALEENLGYEIKYLSYPGGNFNARVIELVKETGYTAAVGVYKIIDQQPKYRYAIRRFHADDALDSITSKLVDY